MKLIDQVITLEQAKQLKELGVKQKSLFYHHPAFDVPVFGETWTTEHGKQYKKTQVCNDKKGSASAFTVAEMGAMLPKTVKLADVQFRYGVMGDCHVQYIIEASESNRILLHKGHQVWTTGKTEAEARAEMLVYLLKNKLITVEEVNARLCNA